MTTVPRAELTGTYALDPAHTQIGFVARHAMVTKVRGSFREFEGTAQIDGAEPERSSVTVTIKAASIDTGNEQRDEHLRTNDFLDAPAHPDITFSSTGVRVLENDKVEVAGDLTIKGTTRSVTIPFSFQGSATDPMGNTRAGFEGSVEISRKDYGVTWNAPLEGGGVLVGDKVVLEFDVSAIKQS
ncbi:YceI family protein [Streptomyces halstedii]|uniref:YceI family protein n=1 Tax=Streptomyces TaxID=1883 RepID=UPI0004903AB9|nr:MULTISPECIES: YceI family protein [Streptomyces]WSX38998.1 YceI family protein [Streptomyces halstedii]MCW8219066.1 polyisoprenoid-binding protein [Streptomyces griseolus]MYQ51608.1 polyisoprenoid-binding protein [Streptomyces sp. SID4941]MYR74136.1 polyisoprenoid-binding protein [Streptomyces sp. SID4925]MYY19195.1 polyisoprenoid-binding protein [Streptomyces sp. SID4912]